MAENRHYTKMTKAQINGGLISNLRSAFRDGKQGLSVIPKMIKKICENGMWREFYDEVVRDVVRHDSFEAFVTHIPPRGLGSSIAQIQGMCRDDPEAIDVIDKACQRKAGKLWDSRTIGNTVDNIHSKSDRPDGTSQTAALRRLRKDRPKLHKQVLAGEMSAHAAMIEAGFRIKTVSFPVDVGRAVAAIQRAFSKEDVARIKEVL